MTDLLNIPSLTELKGLLGDELFAITGMFAEQLQVDLAAIEALHSAQDHPVLAKRAHAVKGSSGNMGAQALSRLAAELETAALARDDAALVRLVTALPALAADSLAEMRRQGFLQS